MRTMNLNLNPMFRYLISDCLQGMGIFLLVMVLVVGLVPVIITVSTVGENTIYFSAYTMASSIFILVYSIVAIRETLRLGIQHGRGRRSTFLALLLSLCCTSLLLAVAGQLLSFLGSALWSGRWGVFYTDFYQLIYLQEPGTILSLKQHAEAFFCNLTLLFAASTVGIFFSPVLFRLNKQWRLVLCIGVPVVFCVVLPGLLSIFPADAALFRMAAAFGEWFTAAPTAWMLFFLSLAIFVVGLDWLLCRRITITAVK